MSASPEGSPAQPKIASFAPELIDEILHHLVAGLDEYPTSYSRLKEIGEYSLISQNWQGPVQRRLMRRLVIKSGTQARRVVDGLVASGLGIHVKDLTIRFSKALWHYSEDLIDEPTSDQIKAVDAVTSDDFLALLPHFPALISLDLDGTPFTQLGPSTPSLTALALESGEYHTDKNPSMRSPVTLPRLQSLDLAGRAYASSFLDLGLLSRDTIARVERLVWFDDSSEHSSAQPLLQIMGPTLKFLRYTTYQGDSRDVAAELQSCAVLEQLDLRLANGVPQGLLGHRPPILHTLTFQNIETARDVLLDDFASRSPSLETVRLDPDFEWSQPMEQGDWWQDRYDGERQEFEEIVETLKDTGVELVVTGERFLKALEEMA